MVMGQFVTNYRKDYLWPYVTTLGFKPEPEPNLRPQSAKLNDCRCHKLNEVRPTNQQMLGPDALKDEQWSRLGPMGPLLEPKIITARVSAPPESEISKFNQPNVFMAKLQEKYPFIYECLKTAPPDDLINRINRERLSTTYQVDFCNKREYPAAPYDELLRVAGVDGLPPCPEPIRLPGDVCRPGQKIKAKRNSQFTKTASQGVERRRMRSEPLQKPYIFHKPVTYTVPKSPPGPYYRPYTCDTCLIFNKEDQARCNKLADEKKNKCANDYLTEMGNWNPFDKEKPLASNIVEKWGRINFISDSLHSHGGHFVLRAKK